MTIETIPDEPRRSAATPQLRRKLTAWLAQDVTGEPLDDVVMAVYEAVGNVAKHAYADHSDGQGPVRLTVHRRYDAIQITIADHGVWRAATGQSYRGRGLHRHPRAEPCNLGAWGETTSTRSDNHETP